MVIAVLLRGPAASPAMLPSLTAVRSLVAELATLCCRVQIRQRDLRQSAAAQQGHANRQHDHGIQRGTGRSSASMPIL